MGRAVRAHQRGARCRLDLTDGWDYWAVVDQPVAALAREYGITLVGVAVEAPGQDPSAAYTARLIDAIKATGVKAIFSEAQFPTKLVDQLAAETGTKVVADLYDDSIGDPPVDSYEGVLDWDANQFVTALR